MAAVATMAPPIDDVAWLPALQAVVAEPDLLRLHAQPIVELTSGAVAGYEMLSRFTGPWQAAPDVWFAAAERWGLNATLQARALRNGIAARTLLPPNTFLTINVDPHLLSDEAVVDALTEPQDLTRLVLELTEHTKASDDGIAADVLNHVRSTGGLVAMDDAGTGYAGLTALLALRPQVVKLDRELITGLDTDPVKRALVEVFGDLAGRMDAWIIAEGIETEAELNTLIGLGVPLGQGWALARPAPTMLEAIDPVVVDHIRTTAARCSLSDHVASLVRPVRSGTDTSDCGVIVGDAGLADQVRDDHGEWTPAMVVAPNASVRETAHRAMTRPAAHRYAPLVCTDGQGRVIGTVGIDDLLLSAVRSSDAAASR